jgi:hypothetical protein
VALLEESSRTRGPKLVPVRYGRMLESPFTFFRGAPLVMASDLSRTPSNGIHIQMCGDAHLLNLGTYATPERNMIFDVNDFDETHIGPWATWALSWRRPPHRRRDRGCRAPPNQPSGPAERSAPWRAGAAPDRSVWDADVGSLLLLWFLTR